MMRNVSYAAFLMRGAKDTVFGPCGLNHAPVEGSYPVRLAFGHSEARRGVTRVAPCAGALVGAGAEGGFRFGLVTAVVRSA